MTAERRSLRSLTEYRLRRTRAPKSAEQPEERSDEAAIAAKQSDLRSGKIARERRTRAPKSAEQPEERSDEAAIAAKQSDLRSGKIATESLPLCKSEVASHFLDTLSDRDIVGGLKVEAKQWLGVGRAQVEPPVATVHG